MERARQSFLGTGLFIALSLVLFGIFIMSTGSFAHASPVPAPFNQAPETEWKDIVGIVTPGNIVGKGAGAVTGGGTAWHTTSGHAEVDLTNGELQFDVKGLVLAGGNSIGTPDGVVSVKGTLVCDTTAAVDSTLVDTPLVTLSAQGNAKFRGNVGVLPVACNQPNIAFLIRTGGGAWLASGMVRTIEKDDDDHDRDHDYDRR